MRLVHASSAFLCVAVLGLSFGACEIKRVNDGGEGGSAGEGSSDDDGGGGEGGGDGSCQDTSPDCRECRACAAAGPCKAAVEECLFDSLCSALDECLALCGISPDCEESCRAQYAPSEEVYDAARQCMDCAACGELCSTLTVCGTN